jgi:hypothetical protein
MNDACTTERGTGGDNVMLQFLLTHLLNLGWWHWQVRTSAAVSVETG